MASRGADLVRSLSPHGGFFVQNFPMQQKIDTFFKYSPYAARSVADGSLKIVIVHDVPSLNVTSHANVSLHQVRPQMSLAPNDARWEAYGNALRSLALPLHTCVFVIDFGDVHPTRDVRELCHTYRNALFAASDNWYVRYV